MHIPQYIVDQLAPSCTRPTVASALAILNRCFEATRYPTKIDNPPKYEVLQTKINLKNKKMETNDPPIKELEIW